MPVRARKPNEVAQQVIPLMLLGVGLVATNRVFTVLDDEASTLASASQSARELLMQTWAGAEQHGYSPLYSLLLHFWLRMARDDFGALRTLPVLFFILGLFVLVRAARRTGGPASALAVAWLGVLWPFGFFYGRLEAGYALSFLLIAALTISYLRYIEGPTRERWAALFLAGVFLLWANYFAFAIVTCLLVDFWIRRRQGESSLPAAPVASLALLWCSALIPIFHGLRHALRGGMNPHLHPVTILANALFCAYTLFVSVSVAPWHWILGVPAMLAVAVCTFLLYWDSPRHVRRLLSYGALLLAAGSVAGILAPNQLMLIAPWVLLPAGVVIGTSSSAWVRNGLAASLLMIAGTGWYGAYSRSVYADQSFLDPWPQVADTAAEKVRAGATVISDEPAFFFYLTYALRQPGSEPSWKMTGLLPDQVRLPQVKSAAEWMAAGHPTQQQAVWVRGPLGPGETAPIIEASRELDHVCGARTSRLMMRDNGYGWRQHVFGETSDLPWRIEVREYECGPASSQDKLPIPAQ